MKNFNNIAGGPFPDYVSNQIENRKRFLKESHNKRNNKHLIYDNNRNSFIRITSNTNLTPEHPISQKYDISGEKLAQKYILQGGLIERKIIGEDQTNFTNFEGEAQQNTNKYTFQNRGGIGNNGLYNTLDNKPLGIKPMPGITTISLSSAGRLGTLQEATINFICYDREQLDIMDALYMKLGFSILIEWGHTTYIDDDLNLNNPIPLNPFNFNNKEELIKAIQDNRIQHQGNYDAMLGVISNFNWEVQPNGSYMCNIRVVGAGDVLDSLKINHSTLKNLKQQSDSNEPSQIADKNLSSLNRALFELNEFGIKYSEGKKFNSFSTFNKDYKKIVNNNLNNGLYKFIQFDETGMISGDEVSIRGNHYSALSNLTDINQIPIVDNTLFTLTTVNYLMNGINSVDKSKLHNQTYITLGHLLALLTSKGLIYSKEKPYIYIDFHDTLNFCHTHTNQMSLDPRVCIIPNNFKSNVLNSKVNLYNTEESFQNGWNKDELSSFLNNYNFYLKTDNPEVRANLMYINININKITDILRNLRESAPRDEISLSKFLNTLLTDISSALGYNNKFRILVDDSSKSLRIIDDKRLYSLDEIGNNKYAEIPIFGKESFVYNYSFKSKIGPNMASMITISAQAEPSLYTEDLFALSNLSRGLTDRLMSDKKIINDVKKDEEGKVDIESIKLLDNYLKGLFQGNKNSFYLNEQSINASKTLYKELNSKYRNEKSKTQKGSTIIPLEFTLDIDGLSGILPNSAFIIPPDFLPTSYLTKKGEVKIAFIIHKIEQIFDNNKWVTRLTGQTINIRFDEEDTFVKQLVTSHKTINLLPPTSYISSNRVTSEQKELQSNIVENGKLPENLLRTIDNEDKYIGAISSDNGRIRLYIPASVSLSQLLEQAEKDNVKFKINSAYRTIDDQINVRKQNAPADKVNDENFILNARSTEFSPYTAIPGTSNHGFGLAVDFADLNLRRITEQSSQYEWLKTNGPKYGFKRIPSEPWHWEYQSY